MTLALLALAIILGPTVQPLALQRQPHDHTIYIVEGSVQQLARFHSEIGSGWKGGILLKTNDKKGQYRYWAFGQRTAPQAREFMFGSIMRGLKLGIEAYDEGRYFPAERAELDALAIKCRVLLDPFFVTPVRELQMVSKSGLSSDAVDCLQSGIRASTTLRALPTYLLGNDATPEKAK